MRDVMLLRGEAMRAYEVGRIRFAARVAFIVVPLTLISAWETDALLECGLAGASLLAVTMGMRWWHRRGVEAASAGLSTGVIPTLAALAVCRFAPSCPPGVALGLCLSAGLVSGAVVGRAAIRRSTAPWQHWAAIAVVAALTATLGCIGLGLGSVVGAAASIALGAAAATALSRPSAV
jgi:hypothetical protein